MVSFIKTGKPKSWFTIWIPALLIFLLFTVSGLFYWYPQMKGMVWDIETEKIVIRTDQLAHWLARWDDPSQQIEGIRDFRYGPEDKNYFWILNMDHTLLVHPYRPDLEGRDLRLYRDPQGNYLFQQIVNTVAQQERGFVNYYWQLFDDTEQTLQKRSYVSRIPGTDLILGTGFYVKLEGNRIAGLLSRFSFFAVFNVVLLLILVSWIILLARRRAKEDEYRQAKLQESEEKYRHLVETMKDGLILQNSRGILEYVNPRFAEMMGRPEKEILGQKTEAFLDEESLRVYRHAMEERQAGGEESYELTFLSRNQGPLRTHISPKSLFSPQGRWQGSFAIITDITPIRETLKEKEILLQEVHHRVKNNLQTISSLLSLQMDDPRLNEAGHEIMQATRSRVTAMAKIHESLYSRNDKGGVDLLSYIHELLVNVESTYGREPLAEILWLKEETLVLPLTIAVPLGLVINEVLTNAYKYAFPGNPEPKMWISLQCSQKHLILQITDNGPGKTAPLRDREKAPQGSGMGGRQGLGSLLIQSLMEQVSGKCHTEEGSGGGLSVTLSLGCPD